MKESKHAGRKSLIPLLLGSILGSAPVFGAQETSTPARTELSALAGEDARQAISVPAAPAGRPLESPASPQALADCVLAAFPKGDPMRHATPEIFAQIEQDKTREQVDEHMREYEEKIMRGIDVKDLIRSMREETGVTEKQVSNRELANRIRKNIPPAAGLMARTETHEFLIRGKEILRGCGVDPTTKPFFAETK